MPQDRVSNPRSTPSNRVCPLWRNGWLLCCAIVAVSGCGTSVTRNGTEQLLASDAIDRSVAQLDFAVLADRRVYFDTQYVLPATPVGIVSSPYIISSIRQRMAAAGCRLQDSAETADYIVEARVGALGTDIHDVTYGLPASNLLSAAATALPNVPAVPTIPEISLANRNDHSATAKIAVFAYHRETRRPVWQSGIAMARSATKNTWVLGAGPIQRGTIYDGVQFAGTKMKLPLMKSKPKDELPVDFVKAHQFADLDGLERQLARQARDAKAAGATANPTDQNAVRQVGHSITAPSPAQQ